MRPSANAADRANKPTTTASAMSGYAASYPATVGKLLAEVQATLGVDIGKVITGEPARPASVG